MKKCKGPCGLERALKEFNHKKTNKDDLSTLCRICNAILCKEWRLKNNKLDWVEVAKWPQQ